MKTVHLGIAAFAAACASGTLVAQEAEIAVDAAAVAPAVVEAVSAEGAESINKDVTTYVSSKQMMEEMFADYAAERGIDYGVPNAKGTTYVCGSATVKANVNSASFIKSRALAYDIAYQDAIAKLVMDLTGQEMIKSVREYYDDQSDDRLEMPKNLEAAETGVMKKLAVLAEAKVDEGLVKMGIDPAKYTDVGPGQKKQLFKDALVKQSLRKAFYSAAGFLPVQTFETRTEKGIYTIGVVLRSDADCTEIAKCLKAKKRPAICRTSGLTIKEALPTDEELLTQFGVRLYFDETGMPSLLSFGQWGSSFTGTDERKIERAMESAFAQAESSANEQLTAFINSKIAVEEASERGEIEEESLLAAGNGKLTEEAIVKVIDKIAKSSTITGNDTLIGRSTVLKKTLQHPSGHKVACVVRRWSFGQLEAAKAIINGGKRPPKPVAKPKPLAPADRGKRSGRTYDF